MIKLVTVGAYGFDAETFFDALQSAEVNTFVDIRWRRGVRGSNYAWANSQRLQTRLDELGIHYLYDKSLAPSPEIRKAQYSADADAKVAKRQRTTLAPAFIAAYEQHYLADFDPEAWLATMPPDAAIVALFCVEGVPQACHRSLVADKISHETGCSVAHLTP
ncbi:MAG: DUF488 domain-containing protein [Anaerolineae bacterium]|nr:DUF488 domain-containing protein [Anaerolineae bacterium]